MPGRAERRLTLTVKQERVIHAFCVIADSAVWALKYGNVENQKRAADDLSEALKAVSHGVMP